MSKKKPAWKNHIEWFLLMLPFYISFVVFTMTPFLMLEVAFIVLVLGKISFTVTTP